MNTVEDIAQSINDFVQREMEYCKEDGVITTYTEELEHFLSELNKVAASLYLYHPNYTNQ